MGQALRASAEGAKPARGTSGTSKGRGVYQILPFELFLREIWPQDRTKNYMRLTGAALRTAKRRISGKHPPDYAEIAAILRSEYGLDFLRHIIGDARPQWFNSVERAKHIGDLRRRVAQQQRELTQLEMDVR